MKHVAQVWGIEYGKGWKHKNYPSKGDLKDYGLPPNAESPEILSARTIYEMENHYESLVKAGLSLDEMDQGTIGVEAALWSEYVPTDDIAWEKTLPRLSVVAEHAWRSPRYRDPHAWAESWPEYLASMKNNLFPRYKHLGINSYYDGPVSK